VASAAQDIRKLDARLADERGQILVSVGAELGHDLFPSVRHVSADVVEHDALRSFVHDDLATRRQEGKAALDLLL